MEFCRSTHGFIPVKKDTYKISKIPLAFALTPFLDNQSVPLIRSTPCCSSCGAVQCYKAVYFTDNSKWICPVCNAKVEASQERNSVQSLVYDLSYTEDDEDLKPQLTVLIVENTEMKAVIGELRAVNDGFFSVFLFDSCLHIPIISRDRKSFTMQSYPDIEGLSIPPPSVAVFNLKHDKELFTKYLDFIESFQCGKPFMNIRSIIDCCHHSNLSPIVCFSKCFVGEIDQAQSYELLRKKIVIDFMYLKPSDEADITQLNELTMTTGSACKAFTNIELMCNHIRHYITRQCVKNVLISATFSDSFKLVDIMGKGLRRASTTYTMPVLRSNETVYFFFDYNTSKIKHASPVFQFKIKFTDSNGNRFARIVNIQETLVDNYSAMFKKIDYNMLCSTLLIKSIDKAREHKTTIASSVEKMYSEISSSSFVKLYLSSLPPHITAKISAFISVVGKIFDPNDASFFYSATPLEIMTYLCPVAYSFNINCKFYSDVPFPIYNKSPDHAWYVVLFKSVGIIYLSARESYESWLNALPSVQEAIKKISKEETVILLHESLHNANPYVQYIKLVQSPLFSNQ